MPEPLIYLDHHATTPLDPRVAETMARVWRDTPGNAASTSHQAGHAARNVVETAREQIAALLRCEPREVIFTSGATEASNLAIKGLVGTANVPRHIVTTAVEHRSVLDAVRRLRRVGHEVSILPVDRFGRVDPLAVKDSLKPHTTLVSVILASNEVGTINPLAEVAREIRRDGTYLHTDAAQAVGKIPVRLDQLPVDLLSFTAHKLYGPQGVGALFVRQNARRVPLQPLLDGGGHEQGLRSGTLPVALIAGFARALEIAIEDMDAESQRLSLLRDELWRMLAGRIPGLKRNGDPAHSLPGNLNVTIPDVDGEALLAALQKSTLCISSGSACTSANPEPSHVLKAMELSDSEAKASLRFGLGRGTTHNDIVRAVEILTGCLRLLSADQQESQIGN